MTTVADIHQAIDDYTKAIEINPNVASFYEGRANAYERIRKNVLEEADRRRARELTKQ